MSVFYIANFDKFFDAVFREINKQIPEERMSVESLDTAKATINPVLLSMGREAALADVDKLRESHEESVRLVAADDPILAYGLSSSSAINKLLNLLDDYFEQVLTLFGTTPTDEILISKVRSSLTVRLVDESLSRLETDILRVSQGVSYRTAFATWRAMRRRKRQLEQGDDSIIEDLVSDLIATVASEHGKRASAEDLGD